VTLRVRKTAARAGLLAWAAFAYALPAAAEDADAVTRGAYVFHLGGCEGCHTDKKNQGPRLGGGRAFKTDFGTFYSPNITPDPDTGIGGWTFADFKAAMREGRRPDGANYFPAFPYPAYTHIRDADLEDLWAYLQAQAPVQRTNTDHDLKAPFGWRWGVTFWNWLYLDKGPRPEWSRGRYVAEALAHCHECHTPRTVLGGRDDAMAYAGTKRNPEGLEVPNITPDPETGIGEWSPGDMDLLFTIGMLPDGDFVGGVMAESVSHATSKMTKADRQALIDYIRARAPLVNRVKTKKARNSGGDEW